VITIYAWNEWTEGGYLEPDTVHGMGYLEAIRNVFADPSRIERAGNWDNPTPADQTDCRLDTHDTVVHGRRYD